MPPEVWAAAGVVITALLGLLGIRATARQSARATEITAAPESRRVDIEGFTALVEALQADNERLANRVGELEEWRRQQAHMLRTHEAWEADVVVKLRHAQIIVAEPPPLSA